MQTEENITVAAPEEMTTPAPASAPAAEANRQDEPSEAETPPAAATDDGAGDETADGLAALLAEAEQRGYLRARNEIAAAAMRKPRLWENSRRAETEPEPAAAAAEPSLASDFLTRIRPNVWD